MAKIIFNEDCNHFLYDRYAAGVRRLEKEHILDFLAQYENTGVTDFLVCVGSSTPWFETKTRDNVLDTYHRWQKEGKVPQDSSEAHFGQLRLLDDFYQREGKTVISFLLEHVRDFGMRPWASLRMNDIHEASAEDSLLFSDFYRKNRHMNRVSHREPSSYYDYALDYHYPEVREYYLSLAKEILDTFDVDGFELDFMREIFSFGVGREYEGIAVMNAFMRDVYAMVKVAEAHWGHPIEIGVRVPDTPEKALRLGFDVFDWVEAGIVDLLVVTPRWSSIDNDLPIDLWKRIMRGKNVEIAAGLEILIDAYNRRPRKMQGNTYETAVASCTNFLSQGADAIYLFNYMDVTGEARESTLTSNTEKYREFLAMAGDYEKCVAAERHHVVTYNDVDAIGEKGKKQLPLRLWGEKGNPPPFSAVRVVTGDVPADRTVQVILGVEPEDADKGENLIVYLNAKRCRFVGVREWCAPQYTDMKYLVFEAENDGDLPPVSVIEMANTDGIIMIHWAEIDILKK